MPHQVLNLAASCEQVRSCVRAALRRFCHTGAQWHRCCGPIGLPCSECMYICTSVYLYVYEGEVHTFSLSIYIRKSPQMVINTRVFLIGANIPPQLHYIHTHTYTHIRKSPHMVIKYTCFPQGCKHTSTASTRVLLHCQQPAPSRRHRSRTRPRNIHKFCQRTATVHTRSPRKHSARPAKRGSIPGRTFTGGTYPVFCCI